MQREILLLKFDDGSYVVGFDKRTVVACWASQFCATIGVVVITWAIGGSRELFEELKVRESGIIDRFS